MFLKVLVALIAVIRPKNSKYFSNRKTFFMENEIFLLRRCLYSLSSGRRYFCNLVHRTACGDGVRGNIQKKSADCFFYRRIFYFNLG